MRDVVGRVYVQVTDRTVPGVNGTGTVGRCTGGIAFDWRPV